MGRTNMETFLLLQRRYMEMISGLTSSEAQTLIDKFFHWQGMFGAEIIAVSTGQTGQKKKKSGREYRLSSRQFKVLMKYFTEYIERKSRDEAELLLRNMELGQRVAKGGLGTALVSRARCEVRINHNVPIETRAKRSGCETHDFDPHLIDMVRKYESTGSGIEHAMLELASFCSGVGTHKKVVRLLRKHGLEPANIDHALAFVRANPHEKWNENVFRIDVPGSVGKIAPSAVCDPLICPVLHAPTDYRPNWTLGYDRVNSRIRGKYHMGTGFDSWLLVVRKEQD